MVATMSEERELVLPRSPSRRLLAPTRWRSFKMIADHDVWNRSWAVVQDYLEDGWTIERVVVDWGRVVPYLGEQREQLLARVFPAGVPVEEVDGRTGQGSTRVYLRRDHA